MIYAAIYDLGNGKRLIDFDNANSDKTKIKILEEQPGFLGFIQIEVAP